MSKSRSLPPLDLQHAIRRANPDQMAVLTALLDAIDSAPRTQHVQESAVLSRLAYTAPWTLDQCAAALAKVGAPVRS